MQIWQVWISIAQRIENMTMQLKGNRVSNFCKLPILPAHLRRPYQSQGLSQIANQLKVNKITLVFENCKKTKSLRHI